MLKTESCFDYPAARGLCAAALALDTVARASSTGYAGGATYSRGGAYAARSARSARSASSTTRTGARRSASSRSASSRSGSARNSSSRGGSYRGGNGHRNYKQRKPRKKHHPIRNFIIFLLILVLGGAAAFAIMYTTTTVPKPEDIALTQKTSVYYSDGTTKIGDYGGQNREIISCSTLPSYVKNAVVSSENRTFWTDQGIDLRGIGRALLNNVTRGTRQGGSTITQQYAERYYLGQTDTYLGKLHEAFLALKITQTQSKQTILCNYLNTIYFGRGAYGIQAAAKAYFGVPASKLTLSQAVMLAGIIPAPSAWDPAIDPTEAKSRFTRTLNIMVEDKHITKEQADQASFPTTLPVSNTVDNVYGGTKGYVLQMVKSELTKDKAFSEAEVEGGGYKIVTTLDKNKQAVMTKVGSSRPAGAPSTLQQGGLSVNPQTGEILAFYAGDDYLKHPLNNVTQAQYEPGSTMKPFALLTAVNKGLSLRSVFNGNSPQTFAGLPKPLSNDGNVSYGYINLYQATANSVNTVYMAVNEAVGPANTAATAKKAGMETAIDSSSPYNVLGINATTLMNIVRAHSTLATSGQKPNLHIVKTVVNNSGATLYTADTTPTRVFDQNNTALVINAMTDVVRHGTGKEALSLGREIAGKTGTANDGTAVSFVGSTPNMVTAFAVWNSAANGNALEVPKTFGGYYGSKYPVHLFVQYSRQAFSGLKVETFPAATDNGTIGGPNGNWGTGRASDTWVVTGPTANTSSSKRSTQSSGMSNSAGTNAGNNATGGTDDSDANNTSQNQADPNAGSAANGTTNSGGTSTGTGGTAQNSTGTNGTTTTPGTTGGTGATQ